MRRLLAAFVLSVLTVPFAQAKSVALVIGNDGYANVPSLQKAVNDARSVSVELERLGFIVRRVENVDQRAMSRAIVAFDADVEAGDRALFFYSGHGFEIGGTNYLLPTDVPAAALERGGPRPRRFASRSTASSTASRAKGASVAILILDACRDNPFAGPGTRSAAAHPGTRPRRCARRRLRADVGRRQAGGARPAFRRDANPNSVFTRTFLAELSKPGQTLVQIAKKTQVEVKTLARSIGHDQTPAYYDQVIGDVVLSGAADAGARVAEAAARSAACLAPTSRPQINTSANTQAGAGVQLGPAFRSGRASSSAARTPRSRCRIPPTRRRTPAPSSAGSSPRAATPPAVRSSRWCGPIRASAMLDSRAGGRAPIANFMRSNSGWTVTLSTPEPATAISYRVGDEGEFRDTGLLDVLDQRTGQRMPNPSFQLSGKAQAAVIQVRYQTSRRRHGRPVPDPLRPGRRACSIPSGRRSNRSGRAGSSSASSMASSSTSPR